jgi:obg-like ATPase 1
MNKKTDVKPPKPLLGRVGNSLKMGIVGFPNVGKSSTFNILSKLNVKAENYPFCTIEPNLAKVPVPDERFDKICEIVQPKSRVPATLTIYDIAGLVPNAHLGEGLGNEFLSHIQAVDGIYHLVRAFDDPEVAHTEGEVDPVRDLEIISNELIMKDLHMTEKRIGDINLKLSKNNDEQLKRERETLVKVKALLEAKKWVKDESWNPNEVDALNDNLFFTAKPVVYLINISEDNFLTKKNKWLIKIREWITTRCPGKMIPFSVEFEKNFENKQVEGQSMIDKIIKTGYEELQLIHFFTFQVIEVRCWSVRKGTKAPQGAGVIHSDFERGFICAEVMKWSDYVELGSEAACKNAGKYKQNGKEYEIEDGDIIFFKFNTPKDNPKKKA